MYPWRLPEDLPCLTSGLFVTTHIGSTVLILVVNPIFRNIPLLLRKKFLLNSIVFLLDITSHLGLSHWKVKAWLQTLLDVRLLGSICTEEQYWNQIEKSCKENRKFWHAANSVCMILSHFMHRAAEYLSQGKHAKTERNRTSKHYWLASITVTKINRVNRKELLDVQDLSLKVPKYFLPLILPPHSLADFFEECQMKKHFGHSLFLLVSNFQVDEQVNLALLWSPSLSSTKPLLPSCFVSWDSFHLTQHICTVDVYIAAKETQLFIFCLFINREICPLKAQFMSPSSSTSERGQMSCALRLSPLHPPQEASQQLTHSDVAV